MAGPKKELSLTVSAPPDLLPPSPPKPSPPDKRKFEKALSQLTEEIEKKKSQLVTESILKCTSVHV